MNFGNLYFLVDGKIDAKQTNLGIDITDIVEEANKPTANAAEMADNLGIGTNSAQLEQM